MSDAASETPASPANKRGCLFWSALLTTAAVVGPMLFAFVASAIADSAGCVLNEAASHPCIVAGMDIGDTLAAAFLMGWLTLLTIWLAPVAIVLWIVWAIARSRRPG